MIDEEKERLVEKRNRLLQYVLVFVGMLSCIGYVLDLQPIRGLGFATVASPLPLVFSHFRGHEAFANELTIKMTSASGKIYRDKIDYRIFSGMTGPYNRRNAYGAVISFGAYFGSDREKELGASVLRYGFCDPAPLVKTYGIEESLDAVEIYVRPRPKGPDSKRSASKGSEQSEQSWIIPVSCQK